MISMIQGDRASSSRFEGITTAEAASAVADQARQAAAGRDILLRIQDSVYEGRWADVAICDWGWAMLWNDGEGDHGDSFGTLGGGGSDQSRGFAQPGGDDLWFPHNWFVPDKEVLQAIGMYVETGKLWRGVTWWPGPIPTCSPAKPTGETRVDTRPGATKYGRPGCRKLWWVPAVNGGGKARRRSQRLFA